MNFLLVSSYITDSTFMASRTGVVVDVLVVAILIGQGFFSFPSWEVAYSIWGPKDYLLGQTNPASSGLTLFVLLALLT